MGNEKDQFTIKELLEAAKAKLDEARDLRDVKKGKRIGAGHEQRLRNTIDLLEDFLRRADPVKADICPQNFYTLPIDKK